MARRRNRGRVTATFEVLTIIQDQYIQSAATTVAPTGLSISRSGNTFTFSWKVGDTDYSAGQMLKYRVNYGAEVGPIGITPGTTSYSVTVTATTVSHITFWVAGKRSPYTTVSDIAYQQSSTKTATYKQTIDYTPAYSGYAGITWYASVPATPSLSYSREGTTGTFTWSASSDNSGTAILRDVELQTCTSNTAENPPARGWSALSVGASGTKEYTDSLTNGNVIRWVRVRSRGPGGNSGWVYQHHAYGEPAKPVLNSASAQIHGSVTRVAADFSENFTILNPIDTVTLQYMIAVPDTMTLSVPEDGSWDDGITISGRNGADRIVMNVSDTAGADECMWVRLLVMHDEFPEYSDAELLVYTGKLKKPDIEATPNVTTGKVAITITRGTDCDAAGHVIFYRSEKRPDYDQIVAVLDEETTTAEVTIDEIKTSNPDHVDHTCFGAYAFLGTYHGLSVEALMVSDTDYDSDILAYPPEWVDLSKGDENDRVRIKWPWTWSIATSAQLAWADHEDAWESTDGPNTYDITESHIASWIIANLDPGKRWFFRVRLNYEDADESIIGPWSDMESCDLSLIPDKPVLFLSKEAVAADASVTARWGYAASDKTTQQYADICLVTFSGDTIVYGNVIAHATDSQTLEITYNWTTGQTYYLALRLTSSAGQQSEWSDPVKLFIVPPLQISVTNCSLETVSGQKFLTALPLSATITGAGASGQTIMTIVRTEEYHIYRPDDTVEDGFTNEVIATQRINGQGTMTITYDDLEGYLDDGAKYKLVCTIIDEYEQVATTEIPFEVNWAHQAGIPSAEVSIDDWQRIAIIKPIAPANYVQGDVCDIYRISADKPELIYEGAQFGTMYVDPYPAFGSYCGHRIVTRTANGDYITADNRLAWFMADVDIGDVLYEKAMIIDMNGQQIVLPYNIELQSSWAKSFRRTAYLGGSVQGDWNPAVLRDVSANTTLLRGRDVDQQLALRNLAGYAGPAHIRTPDGSSMWANAEVRETWSYQTKRMSYSLAIKVIDPAVQDGVTYEEWLAANPVR